MGESHPKAKLTDHDIDLIRELATQRNDEGAVVKPGLSLRVLAEKFEMSKAGIQRIVNCTCRAVLPVRWKLVSITEE